MFQAQSYVGHKLCWPDDLVINSLWAWGRGLGVARHHGIVSSAYGVYRNRSGAQFQSAYLHQLVRSEPFQWELQVRSQGVWKSRLQMTDARWLDAPLLLPPVDEQAAIVKYLAHANARIDKAIAAKRRLIALLNESDRAIASQILADLGSGPGQHIPWLGLVPASWNVVPAKRLFREFDRRSSTGSEGLLSLRMREGLVDANVYTVTPIPPADLVGYKVVDPGEIVMNRMRASIGLFGVAQVSGLVSPDYSTMAVAHGVDPAFYLLLFKTDLAMSEFRKRSTGLGTGSSGFMRLYYEEFGAVPMPVPSLEEQRRIVATVVGERAMLAPVATRAHQEINVLQEFRTRLVADVVTGQVDVRDVAASLPELDSTASWGGLAIEDAPDPADFDNVIEAGED